MKDSPTLSRHRALVRGIIFITIIAFVAGVADIIPLPSIDVRWPNRSSVATDQYVPVNEIKRGRELVMVYIGSSTCGYANLAEIPELIERIKLLLQKKAYENGMLFSTMGISIDWKTENGVLHLAKMGHFDEITTGRNLQGLGVHQFVWSALSGEASTPQVLVVTRTINAPSEESPYQSYHVSKATLIIRKAGVTAISSWLDRGSPLPLDLLNLGSKGG